MKDLKQTLAEALEEELEIEVTADDIEVPEPEHGDFAYPAMKAASEKEENPRKLAEKLSEKLEIDGVEKIEVAGPGYLNFFVDREEYSKNIIESEAGCFENKEEKVLVEHTSPNPNKPLHMGTMRCAVLGDSISRLADKLGYEVEVQDYINDLGRQSARTVYAYQNFLDELDEEDKEKKDDYWIGLLYSKAGSYLENNPEAEEKVQEIIQETEEGGNEISDLKDEIVEKSLRGQLATAHRSNIFYDYLMFERDIMASGLLAETKQKLMSLDAVHRIEEGEDKECIVIDLEDYKDELGSLKKPYKILFRSDGTATYNAKDIALTMWKFGLLESSVGFKEFYCQPNGKKMWSTGGESEKDFGNADQHLYVVGERQSYLAQVIQISLRALGFEDAADSFDHVGFEFVYLPGKESYSGRKGNWVGKHGDAVLDKCQKMALEEIQDRYDFSEEKEQEIAEKVAVAAVRYFILKFSREKDIDFSFEKALDWEGDSGPYLLYSNARAHGILEKSDEKPEFHCYESEIEYELVRKIAEFEEVVEESFDSREPTKLAHYVKELAETFNSFYHKCPVNSADTEELKQSRLKITEAFTQTMEQGLELLGIEPLEEM